MRKPTRPLARRIDERQPVPYQQRSPEPVFCTENERCRGCPYCKVITSQRYWVSKTNNLLPATFYTFGADGKMVR